MNEKSIMELTKIAMDSIKINLKTEIGQLTDTPTIQNYSLFIADVTCGVYDLIDQHYNSES